MIDHVARFRRIYLISAITIFLIDEIRSSHIILSDMWEAGKGERNNLLLLLKILPNLQVVTLHINFKQLNSIYNIYRKVCIV